MFDLVDCIVIGVGVWLLVVDIGVLLMDWVGIEVWFDLVWLFYDDFVLCDCLC